MSIFRRLIPARRRADHVEAAVLPGTGMIALRLPGESVPRMLAAETGDAIADAVILHRRIQAEIAQSQATAAPGTE